MVSDQLRRRGVNDARVLEAMLQIPRERFLPPALADFAYEDRALAIGEGQTISQPLVVAWMASLLELDGCERVLEVGAGSGYGAAVLSRCCREVVSVELRPALAERAREALAAAGCANVAVVVGDGALGLPALAPFGGISVTARCERTPPAALLDQLEPGAALVAPVAAGGNEQRVRYRHGRGEPQGAVRFVALERG